MSQRTPFLTIDEYILQAPLEAQEKLTALRALIREEAPDATEKISYAIPTFYLNGNLVHFAAFKHHIGFYPGAEGIEVFSEDLKTFKSAKGSVQFPLEQPLPEALVRRIVRYRVEANRAKGGRGRRKAPPAIEAEHVPG